MHCNHHPIGTYALEVKALKEMYDTKMFKWFQITEDLKEINFNLDAERLKQDYLNIFEGGKSETLCTIMYDEDSSISKTYKGTSNMKRQDALKGEHKVPTTEYCYIDVKLWDGTKCRILLNRLYLNHPLLYPLP